MIFTESTWAEVGKGFRIVGASIREPHRHAFVFVEEEPAGDEPPLTRIVFTNDERADPEERYYPVEYTNLTGAMVATRAPRNESVVVAVGDFVYGYDDEVDGREEPHPRQLPGTDLVAAVTSIARVGAELYTVGTPRRVHRRVGIGEWQDIARSIPIPVDFLGSSGSAMVSHGFNDIDGFSGSDMVAVGGMGDVWAYDGALWRQCTFPSEELLHNVCCANEKVFIGGNMGRIWVGRADRWTLLSSVETSMPWTSIKAFQGRLFLGSDFGLHEIKEGKVVRADVPDQVQRCSGSLDVHHSGQYLLTAGRDGASLFDGRTWKVLFDRAELT